MVRSLWLHSKLVLWAVAYCLVGVCANCHTEPIVLPRALESGMFHTVVDSKHWTCSLFIIAVNGGATRAPVSHF